jgi:hypothetical protein
VIRAIFMITFLAERSIRPTADDFYPMALVYLAGGDGGRRSLELLRPTNLLRLLKPSGLTPPGNCPGSDVMAITKSRIWASPVNRFTGAARVLRRQTERTLASPSLYLARSMTLVTLAASARKPRLPSTQPGGCRESRDRGSRRTPTSPSGSG